jgi:hypothetical protein
MHAFDALNGSKSHAIDRHLQAFPFDLLTVPLRGRVVINELTTAIDTDVILFTSAIAIFTNMRRLALRALHQNSPRFIPSLCNADF